MDLNPALKVQHTYNACGRTQSAYDFAVLACHLLKFLDVQKGVPSTHSNQDQRTFQLVWSELRDKTTDGRHSTSPILSQSWNPTVQIHTIFTLPLNFPPLWNKMSQERNQVSEHLDK